MPYVINKNVKNRRYTSNGNVISPTILVRTYTEDEWKRKILINRFVVGIMALLSPVFLWFMIILIGK